jgi:SAM-dependent methyltransferase/transcription elongation GreA/GreB family factor
MERATKDHFDRVSLRHEHTHRYELASYLSRNVVVDCACGIGYGSKIIARNEAVKSYLGIDTSEEAIASARENYAGERIRFETGSLEDNSCASASVDLFVMFETLEHTKNPGAALSNVRRCLKNDGLLIGSVPSAEYEMLCESTYGPNPYHLQRFSKYQITEILGEYFEACRVYSMEFILGSLLRDISENAAAGLELVTLNGVMESGISGSIVFFAGSAEAVAQAIHEVGVPNKFFPSIPKAIFDRDEVGPIRETVRSMEAMIRERDAAIASQAHLLEERLAIIQSLEAGIRERDEAIADQARLIEEHLSIIKSMEVTIRARDGAITEKVRLLEDRLTTSPSIDDTIRDGDGAVALPKPLLDKLCWLIQAIRDRLSSVMGSLRRWFDRLVRNKSTE